MQVGAENIESTEQDCDINRFSPIPKAGQQNRDIKKVGVDGRQSSEKPQIDRKEDACRVITSYSIHYTKLYELGLDMKRFRKDIAAADTDARIDAQRDFCQQDLDARGTPTFFINGLV